MKYAYEKEIVLYAHHKQLDYFTTECIYSPEAFRGSARSLIKSLERVRPSAILDIVRSGEAFAGMVPKAIQFSSYGSDQAVDGAEVGGGGGGCGSNGGGRASGGEMAGMEKQLLAEESAKGLETEVAMLVGQKARKQTPKKIREQKMSSCRKCGYLTSQEFCKACTLLEGLNRNRPTRSIEMDTGIEGDDSIRS